ncbi:hypothetical protein GGR54DRAFT_578871 [Hypoxylon sp. NC1633]|nr:hypothetical protein GGR54DRAFT_578871 [Hypoxylon sp. NC1633]
MEMKKDFNDGSGLEVSPVHTAPEVVSQRFQYHNYEGPPQWHSIPPQSIAPYEGEVPRVVGLRRATFWLLIALFTVVALAIGLGTGLGLGLKNNNNTTSASAASASGSSTTTPLPSVASPTSPSASSSLSTTSSSTSTSSIAQPTPSSLEQSGCPNRNGTTITKGDITYRIYCDSDLTGSDLASLVTTSLEQCLSMCDSMNWTQDRRDVGSVYNANGVVEQAPGTCWCKGGDKIKVTAKAGIAVASPLPTA